MIDLNGITKPKFNLELLGAFYVVMTVIVSISNGVRLAITNQNLSMINAFFMGLFQVLWINFLLLGALTFLFGIFFMIIGFGVIIMTSFKRVSKMIYSVYKKKF